MSVTLITQRDLLAHIVAQDVQKQELCSFLAHPVGHGANWSPSIRYLFYLLLMLTRLVVDISTKIQLIKLIFLV